MLLAASGSDKYSARTADLGPHRDNASWQDRLQTKTTFW